VSAVREADAASLLDIVEAGAVAEGFEPFPSSVLHALARFIPSDAYAVYEEVDVAARFRVVEEVMAVGHPTSASAEAAIHSLGWQDPLHSRLHAREQRVLRLSDFLSRRQRRALEYDAAVWRPHGIEDSMRVFLPAPAGRARSIYLERSGRNYTDRERRLLTLLRPHLVRMRARAGVRRRLGADRGLTPREAEVLAWIARGKTNREIARLLYISPHTVRKHIENVFEKLDVRTRTAAARIVWPREPRPERDDWAQLPAGEPHPGRWP
jgi:DNA-binding CsgD family transcriptional regulator